jgi:predicted nucleotidyltransferase
MGNADQMEFFFAKISAWASARPDIHAAALVGSHARGTAKPDSDIDIVLLVDDPNIYKIAGKGYHAERSEASLPAFADPSASG